MPKSPSIADVAAVAGVSKATAGAVLSDRGTRVETTRQKVLDAAKQLGYKPPVRASSGSLIGVGIKMHVGDYDPVTGLIGKSRLQERADANGVPLTQEMLKMLTYADKRLNPKRTQP